MSHKGSHNPYDHNGAPFDKPFHWILNVAVGGNFFPTSVFGPHVTPEEAKHWEKPTMEIDFVIDYLVSTTADLHPFRRLKVDPLLVG